VLCSVGLGLFQIDFVWFVSILLCIFRLFWFVLCSVGLVWFGWVRLDFVRFV
jgi:hypothetical protein